MGSHKSFRTKFHEFSRRQSLLDVGDKIIVAVSGGVDSIVMLDLFAGEQQEYRLTLAVAHVNHLLRGAEADQDEQFVAHRAEDYGFEFHLERADTSAYAKAHNTGIQDAARQIRYDFFEKVMKGRGFDKITTAHNADDNAETILLNLFRGAGPRGLSGIPSYREAVKVIRPLLFAERHEIESYATAESLHFRADSSNEKDIYTRNFIRHHILPRIKDGVNPNVVQTLRRSGDLFRELDVFATDMARRALEQTIVHQTEEELSLSVPQLLSQPVFLQHLMVMLAAEPATDKSLEYGQVVSILDLARGESGSQIELSKDHVVCKDRDTLVIRKASPANEFLVIVHPNEEYQVDGWRFVSQIIEKRPNAEQGREGTEYVDADRLQGKTLVLRSWKEGDAFVPLGMTNKKKVSDFFIDAKIPLYEKHNYPILETTEGEVVWLCGQRIDDRFKITSATHRMLRLEFSRSFSGSNGTRDKG